MRNNNLLLQPQIQFTQQQIDEYWKKYFRLGLTMQEAIKEYKASLEVQERDYPRLLIPDGFRLANLYRFTFAIDRKITNNINSDNPVLPHEVMRKVFNYFLKCGFTDFKINCKQKEQQYLVTFYANDLTEFGKVLPKNVGTITTSDEDDEDGSFYNKCKIQLPNGFSFELRDGTSFEIYLNGMWQLTKVKYNAKTYQFYLSNMEKVSKYFGFYARIKQ